MAVDETTNGSEEAPVDVVDALMPTTELENEIIRQIEYYFGDVNLCRDRFLQEETKKDDGWISLELLVKFNRLKQLSTDFDVITKALGKSKKNLMEVSEDKQKIRRNPVVPVPGSEEMIKRREEEYTRTIYVKGFPLDSEMDNLLDFFKPYNIESVYMRRIRNGKHSFKGSVFVLFPTKEKSEEFFALPSIKYSATGIDLHRERRVEYAERKSKEYQEIVKQREEKKLQRNSVNTDSAETKKDLPSESFNKGCLLKLKNLNDKTSWEDIKKMFTPHAEVAYVEFARGLTEAVVRFTDQDGAKQALEQARTGNEGEKKLFICDSEIEAYFLEGEDEIEFWKDFHKRKLTRNTNRNHSRNSRGRGRGRGRGSYRGGRRDNRGDRKRHNESEGDHAAKEIKTEEGSDVKTKPSGENKLEEKTDKASVAKSADSNVQVGKGSPAKLAISDIKVEKPSPAKSERMET